MARKHTQKSIEEVYNRLKELINPVDGERLQLDSVHQIKNVVRTFYIKKSAQCSELLAQLDRMTSERPHSLSIKKQLIVQMQEAEILQD